jgi:protein up-regulated during meiosis
VGIEVQTMRVMTTPLPFTPLRIGSLDEMLVVRWVTEPSSLPSEFLRGLASRMAGGEPEVHEFMGLFVFQFNLEGQILDHTIECAEHSRRWSKGVGSRVVRLTDQILGGIRGENDGTPLPSPFRALLDREKQPDPRKRE